MCYKHVKADQDDISLKLFDYDCITLYKLKSMYIVHTPYTYITIQGGQLDNKHEREI